MSFPLRSLRARLTVALLVGFTALLAGTAWWTESTLSAHAARDFDDNLLAKLDDLATLVEQENGVVEFDYVARFQTSFERSESPDCFQIWLGDGQELMRSRWLRDDLGPPTESSAPRFADQRLADGRLVRHVSRRFLPKSPAEEAPPPIPPAADPEPPLEIVMAVARGREALDATLRSLQRTILMGTLLAALLGSVAIALIVRLGLRPVGSIADQVGRLGADELQARIGVPDAPSELAPIVHQVNALLDRLQEARQRERRFAGNVAHELRTPVAELRSLASVAQRWPDDVEAVRGFFGDVGEVAQRMEGIIADLLLLARIQGGAERMTLAPIPLRALVVSTLARHAGPATSRVHVDVAADAVATSDPGKLAIVLDNLIGNACAYHRPGTEITCRGGTAGERFWLEVRNVAEPMAKQDLANLGEPFWRRDEARSAPDHAGLGLAVVRALGQLLQLDIRFAQDPDSTFVARVEGPAAIAGAFGPQTQTPAITPLQPAPLQKPA